jgi:hypothetical protein
MLIIVLYWFPTTKFEVLEVAFTAILCDTDIVRDVVVSESTISAETTISRIRYRIYMEMSARHL